MPISPIVLQRRHAELGRIRLGDQQAITKRNGDPGTRPRKLEKFRFTSPSERYIRDLAELYGGQAQPWDNNGKAEWEVYSDAQSIPVIAVKGGLSQWMETWSGGGCVHRCDGEVQVDGTLCDPNDELHQDAKPTTRLSLMLPELEAIGVFRMESHGWNAAAEIPAVAELAQFVGDLVPATLHLVERRAVKDGKTSRFVVPVLDLQIGTARLKEIVEAVSGGRELAAGGGHRAIEAPQQPAGQRFELPTPEQVAAAEAGVLRQMLADLEANGFREHRAYVAVSTRLAELDPDGAVEAELVDELDENAVWQQVLAEAGRQGLTEDELKELFTVEMGGAIVQDATGAELAVFLEKLQAIGAAA